jgi:hypothetical protein
MTSRSLAEAPPVLRRAMGVFYVALALGLVRSILDWAAVVRDQGGIPFLMFVLLVSVLVIELFFVLQVARGRHWARVMYLVLFLMGAPYNAGALIRTFGHAPYSAAVGALQLALQGLFVAMLFSRAAGRWFRPVSADAQAPAVDLTPCPFCREPIRHEAIRCRYCGSDLPSLGSLREVEEASPVLAGRVSNAGTATLPATPGSSPEGASVLPEIADDARSARPDKVAGSVVDRRWSWPRRAHMSRLLVARSAYQAYLTVTVSSTLLMAPSMLFGVFAFGLLALLGLPVALARRAGLLSERVPRLVSQSWGLLGAPFDFAGPVMDVLIAQLVLPIMGVILIAFIYLAWRVYRAATDDQVVAIVFIGVSFAVVEVAYLLPHSRLFAAPGAPAPDPDRTFSSVWFMGILALVAVHLIGVAVTRASHYAQADARAPRFGLRTLATKYRLRADVVSSVKAELLPHLRRQVVRAAVATGVLVLAATYVMTVTGGAPSAGLRLALYDSAVALALLSCLVSIWAHPGYRGWNALLAMLVLLQLDELSRLASAPEAWESVALFVVVAVGARSWLFAPLRDGARLLRRRLMDSASVTLARSGLPPVLLLRSFQDDAVDVRASNGPLRCALGESSATKPLEEVIGDTLFATGPVITVSDPEARVAHPAGAVRDSLRGDWQAYVVEKMEAARLIVCVVGTTSSLRWEIERILEMGLTRKTLFVAAPGYPRSGTVWAAHPGLAEHIGIGSEVVEHALGSQVRVFGYDRQQRRWTSYETVTANERAYSTCLRIASELAIR